jgi:tRNA(adenine34) deaminase
VLGERDGEAESTIDGGELFDESELMGVALEEARAALAHDDVPVGALVVRRADGAVLARRHNERELSGDPTAHAELLAIADAAREREGWRLDDCALVVTLEPCPMCAGAALAARIPLVVFGAADPKAGALGSLYHFGSDPRLHHGIDVRDGVRAEESSTLLKEFFAGRRLQ